jgi:ribosomal protein S6
VKRYEGLIILNTAAKEEGVKDAVDKITAEIKSIGGKVETVQKMDKRNFMRVANKKHSAGFYVNVIFESQPEGIATLRKHLALNEDVFRAVFTAAPPAKSTATR